LRIEFHPCDHLPGEVSTFWHETSKANDPVLSYIRNPEWFRMMAKGRDDASRVAVLRLADGTIRTVAPLLPDTRPIVFALAGKRLTQVSVPVVGVVGGDFIDAEASADEIDALVAGILKEYPEAWGVWCDTVADGPRSVRLRRTNLTRGRHLHQILYSVAHCRLVLPETKAACRNLRSRKTVSKIEGRERAMGRQHGPCRVVEIRNEQD